MKAPMFALVDCNNFFVSCERLFRPDLEGKPVIVLSSNDGCAVARSNEAKALGIPMAAPAFKYREIIEKNNVIKFSANFELYGGVSKRIIDVLSTITPHLEVYSVDECFMDLSALDIKDLTRWGTEVKRLIQTWVGIPVSIGIAPSKTLAKLASNIAKKDPAKTGVLHLDPKLQDQILQLGWQQLNNRAARSDPAVGLYWDLLSSVGVDEVWGVGRKIAPKLRAEGVATALDLANMRPRHAQKIMGIQGRQTVAELRGQSCWPIEQLGKVPKSISSTRTFGSDTNDFNVIESAIANFSANAAFKLRRAGCLATKATLFISTSRFKPGYVWASQDISLNTPTSDTGHIAKILTDNLLYIYKPHTPYHRAGIILYDFIPEGSLQTNIFNTYNLARSDESKRRMNAVDVINGRYGRQTIKFAAEDMAPKWQPKQNMRSPRYTSRWGELPIIKAC